MFSYLSNLLGNPSPELYLAGSKMLNPSDIVISGLNPSDAFEGSSISANVFSIENNSPYKLILCRGLFSLSAPTPDPWVNPLATSSRIAADALTVSVALGFAFFINPSSTLNLLMGLGQPDYSGLTIPISETVTLTQLGFLVVPVDLATDTLGGAAVGNPGEQYNLGISILPFSVASIVTGTWRYDP